MNAESITMQAQLKARLRFETLIADLSSKFVNLSAEEVDREIEDALRRVCESLGIDLAVLWQWSGQALDVITPTHFHYAHGNLQMPGLNGLDLQSSLAQSGSPLPIVFLTGQGDVPTTVQAMRGGADDFLTKPVKKAVLFSTIDRALACDAQKRARHARRREARARFDTLTPREREVLAHVLKGQLNKQIAGELDAAERTIKAHRANLMAKIQVQSVAELAHLAHEAGFISV